MTAGRHPWLVSLAVHVVVAAAAVSLLRVPEQPSAVRMHLSPPSSARTARAVVGLPPGGRTKPQVPELPAWKEHGAAQTAAGAPPARASLDELLPPAEAAPSPTGWVSEGYSPPPLPPPELAPPQGADWSIIVSVPGGGGPGAAAGLDSGHPELDQWLETYLRTISFPPGLDGQPYQVRWRLKLVTDRPR